MCGVVGIVASENVNQLIYDALIVLQHRGQDAAGMMTFGEGRFNQRKGNGLVSDVFRQHHMERLQRKYWYRALSLSNSGKLKSSISSTILR